MGVSTCPDIDLQTAVKLGWCRYVGYGDSDFVHLLEGALIKCCMVGKDGRPVTSAEGDSEGDGRGRRRLRDAATLPNDSSTRETGAAAAAARIHEIKRSLETRRGARGLQFRPDPVFDPDILDPDIVFDPDLIRPIFTSVPTSAPTPIATQEFPFRVLPPNDCIFTYSSKTMICDEPCTSPPNDQLDNRTWTESGWSFTPYGCEEGIPTVETVGWQGDDCSPLMTGFASAISCLDDTDCAGPTMYGGGDERCVDGEDEWGDERRHGMCGRGITPSSTVDTACLSVKTCPGDADACVTTCQGDDADTLKVRVTVDKKGIKEFRMSVARSSDGGVELAPCPVNTGALGACERLTEPVIWHASGTPGDFIGGGIKHNEDNVDKTLTEIDLSGTVLAGQSHTACLSGLRLWGPNHKELKVHYICTAVDYVKPFCWPSSPPQYEKSGASLTGSRICHNGATAKRCPSTLTRLDPTTGTLSEAAVAACSPVSRLTICESGTCVPMSAPYVEEVLRAMDDTGITPQHEIATYANMGMKLDMLLGIRIAFEISIDLGWFGKIKWTLFEFKKEGSVFTLAGEDPPCPHKLKIGVAYKYQNDTHSYRTAGPANTAQLLDECLAPGPGGGSGFDPDEVPADEGPPSSPDEMAEAIIETDEWGYDFALDMWLASRLN